MPSDLIRGWIPVGVKKTRQNKNSRAFSSEVDTGSREENASKQESLIWRRRAAFRRRFCTNTTIKPSQLNSMEITDMARRRRHRAGRRPA
ncbi:MAG: hypothetical protein KGR71_07970 [Proteobacteria bacterium]|nr:hypothetical protein [Pseudomonadota bacterium]